MLFTRGLGDMAERPYNRPAMDDLTMTNDLRIGAVSYLNTKPLVHGLDVFAPHAQVVYDLPSRLADQLHDGQLDVALIPSVELLRNPDYTIVSDACIACRGPVLSVKLYFRLPPERIKTVALDEGSRTSVALVEILLAERYGLRPTRVPLPIGNTLTDANADAVLLIGDRAMQLPDADFHQVWDLGDEWCRWAERPFVFAMWTARSDRALPGIATALSLARDSGLRALDEIARRESSAVGLSVDRCRTYLHNNLHFQLGSREIAGLELYARHAARLGLVPAARKIEFHDCEAT